MKKVKISQEELDNMKYMFRPIDLTETNVNAIFERCLGEYSDDFTSIEIIQLLERRMGFTEVDKPIVFNRQKSEQNKKNVAYLLGQLNVVGKTRDLPFEYSEATKKYNGKLWTTSSANLAKLFYLGYATKLTGPFMKKNNITNCSLISVVKPTLSPSDPNFPAWWEKHKSEWEDKQGPVLNKKSAGTEPADN